MRRSSRLLARRTDRFLREPPTVRGAATTIVVATVIVVVLGAVLVRVFAPRDFPNLGLALWWSLQTATTVGYGDVTPTTPAGRAIAAVVMLDGIAFLAVVTAAITSTFVARAQRARGTGEAAAWKEVEARLDRIEAALGSPRSPDRDDAASGGVEFDQRVSTTREEP